MYLDGNRGKFYFVFRLIIFELRLQLVNEMSINLMFQEVVTFLQEFQTIDIMTGVVAKSRAPRATVKLICQTAWQ